MSVLLFALESPTIIILVVAAIFLLFGGSKLPQLAKALGQSKKAFKDGMDEADRDDRGTGPHGQHRHPGVAPVEAPVLRAGPLGIDAEQLTGLEGPGRRFQGPLPVGALPPPERDVPVGPEEPGHLPVVEVLRLGDVADPAGHDEGQEERVAERDVVGGQDGRPPVGDVPPPLHPDPEEQAEVRRE